MYVIILWETFILVHSTHTQASKWMSDALQNWWNSQFSSWWSIRNIKYLPSKLQATTILSFGVFLFYYFNLLDWIFNLNVNLKTECGTDEENLYKKLFIMSMEFRIHEIFWFWIYLQCHVISQHQNNLDCNEFSLLN